MQRHLIDEPTWRARQRAHRERVQPWVGPRQERRSRGVRHPVDDFLFEYYPYSVKRLLTWHPGAGALLAGDASALLEHPSYIRTDDGVGVDLTRVPRPDRLPVVIDLLERTAERPAATGCFALHEWAMVYGLKQDEVRHEALPLRLSPREIAETVDELGLRCTHIDAFRFFTASASPMNAFTPTRAEQSSFEQPGCLHANMDLYKYAMWFSPFVTSELTADCFELARSARDLDMRSSPYDCRSFGLEPIRVETADGRAHMTRVQRDIATVAAGLRQRLLDELRTLLALSTIGAPA